MPEYDLVIRNGVIVDGSGMPGVRGDVAVKDGRIAMVGSVSDSAHEELDAEGHVVCPGFIEGHTHMDAQVFWDPLGTCSCWHGVTTAVMGNCGFTLAPVRPGFTNLVAENLECAEDIPAAVLTDGVDWRWEHFSEYLDAVDQQPKAINYAAYVGHSALRTWAMGPDGFARAATADEMSVMVAELQDAMAAGAVGLSTSRSQNHFRQGGLPVASRLADWTELCGLVDVVATQGRGLLELAQEPGAMSDDDDARDEWYGRLRTLAVASGVPTTFGAIRSMLGFIDETAVAGGDIFGQCNSRGTSAVLSFRTQLPFDRIPEWRAIRELPLEEQHAMLSDDDVRTRLVAAAHHTTYTEVLGADPRPPEFDAITVLDEPIPPNPSVAEAAAALAMDPVEFMIQRAIDTNLNQLFMQPYVVVSDDDILAALRHPRTVLAFSDSGAHVSQIIDCSIYTHLFAYWVRQRQAFTVEEAVRMVTLEPAARWRLADRGLLREGFVADINVIDPETIGPNLPTVACDLPGGVQRLTQTATGILATVVGGSVVFRSGQHTGALPGQLIRAR
jgi:N-acyl-D-aspartate/D-glutamate deacylase